MEARRNLYNYAISLLGLPYKWGGDDPIAGFDCSGLVIELLISQGVFPKGFDSTANGLHQNHAIKPIKNPKFGALCFFGSQSKVTHVGFCLDRDLMLEAGGGGSKTKTEKDAEVQNAFIRIRPISSRNDLVGYGWPSYPYL